jgi:hypothetical protein
MTDRPISRGPDGRTLSPAEVATLLREMIGQHLDGGYDDCTAWHDARRGHFRPLRRSDPQPGDVPAAADC